MATKSPVKNSRGDAVDSRDNSRVVVDVPKALADDFAIMAIRRGFRSKRALLIRLISDFVDGKISVKNS